MQARNYAKYLRVLENTDRFLIAEKQPGVSFHAEGNREGLLQIIREMEETGALPSGPRLYPVHRLDRITSGLIVFARERKNANLLSNEFRHHRVEKYYIALSDRPPRKKQGRVIGDMSRGRGKTWILNRSAKNPAVTFFFSKAIRGSRPGLRLFLLKPRTGRTHQIRSAMKSLSAPVLGDPLYGRYDLAREEDRAYLHAFCLRFRLGEESWSFVSPPSPGAEFESRAFQNALREYSEPWKLSWPG